MSKNDLNSLYVYCEGKDCQREDREITMEVQVLTVDGKILCEDCNIWEGEQEDSEED